MSTSGKNRQVHARDGKTSREFRKSMYPGAICSRSVGFIGRLAAAACTIYIGSICSVAANPRSGTFDRANSGSGNFCMLSQNDAPLGLSGDNDDRSILEFCIVDLDAVTLRMPEVIRILRVPVRCFYCRHERGPKFWYNKYEIDVAS